MQTEVEKDEKIANPQEERRKRITEDLRVLREWTNGGSGIPVNLITHDLFHDLASESPEAFSTLLEYATINSRLDSERLNLMKQFPEIWTWPNENERNWLIIQAHRGKGQAALDSLLGIYADMISNIKSRAKMGFLENDKV